MTSADRCVAAYDRLTFLLDWQEAGDPDFYRSHLRAVLDASPEAREIDNLTRKDT